MHINSVSGDLAMENWPSLPISVHTQRINYVNNAYKAITIDKCPWKNADWIEIWRENVAILASILFVISSSDAEYECHVLCITTLFSSILYSNLAFKLILMY